MGKKEVMMRNIGKRKEERRGLKRKKKEKLND